MRKVISSFFDGFYVSDSEKDSMFKNLQLFDEVASGKDEYVQLVPKYLHLCQFVCCSSPGFKERNGKPSIEEAKEAIR